MKKNEPVKNESQIKKNGNNGIPDNLDDALDLGEAGKSKFDSKNISPEKILIIEEISELLSSENITDAVSKFKADSEEKKIALEYSSSHIQFLNELIDNDSKKGITRTDVEIRDMVSHINLLLKSKDEFLFNTIVVNSPSHYKNIQKKYISKAKKTEDKEKKSKS